jgi:hypothetical protein
MALVLLKSKKLKYFQNFPINSQSCCNWSLTASNYLQINNIKTCKSKLLAKNSISVILPSELLWSWFLPSGQKSLRPWSRLIQLDSQLVPIWNTNILNFLSKSSLILNSTKSATEIKFQLKKTVLMCYNI